MSQDPFDQKKAQILQEVNQTLNDVKDLSPKGSIDELCIPIMNLINKTKDMVTTSSCSGRVSVFLEGSKIKDDESVKIGGKGDGGHWLFVTHNKNELLNWYKSQPFIYDNKLVEYTPSTRYILYKFEPLILHVKCRNFESASKLYTTAMNCGFRESGIGTNNIVAIRISIKLDIPIGYYGGDNKLLIFVDENYLRTIETLSLERFKENERKLEQLYKNIELMIKELETPVVHIETKEERRERKIREGKERQLLKNQEKEKQAALATVQSEDA